MDGSVAFNRQFCGLGRKCDASVRYVDSMSLAQIGPQLCVLRKVLPIQSLYIAAFCVLCTCKIYYVQNSEIENGSTNTVLATGQAYPIAEKNGFSPKPRSKHSGVKRMIC